MGVGSAVCEIPSCPGGSWVMFACQEMMASCRELGKGKAKRLFGGDTGKCEPDNEGCERFNAVVKKSYIIIGYQTV